MRIFSMFPELPGTKPWVWAVALLAVVLVGTVGVDKMTAQTPPVQLVLKFKPNAGLNVERGRFVAPVTRGAKVGESISRLNDLVGQPLVTNVSPLISGGGTRTTVEPGLARYYAIHLKPGTSAKDVEQLRSRLASQDMIEEVYVAPVPEDPKASPSAGGTDPGVPSSK